MTFAGGNPGIIKAEIFNLQGQREGIGFVIESLGKNITDLFYRRAEVITNMNLVLAQSKEINLPEGIKKNLLEKSSFLKNELTNIQYQIDTTQERIRSLKSSEYSYGNIISSKKKILNNITGDMVAKRLSEGSFQVNKELGRIKG